MWKVNGRQTTDAKWWQGALKKHGQKKTIS
jgi:hypothetical protein